MRSMGSLSAMVKLVASLVSCWSSTAATPNCKPSKTIRCEGGANAKAATNEVGRVPGVAEEDDVAVAVDRVAVACRGPPELESSSCVEALQGELHGAGLRVCGRRPNDDQGDVKGDQGYNMRGQSWQAPT